jgi:hypothetical protein
MVYQELLSYRSPSTNRFDLGQSFAAQQSILTLGTFTLKDF